MSKSKETWASTGYDAELVDGPLHELDALERDFERAGSAPSMDVPDDEEAPVSTTKPIASVKA